MNFRIRQPFRTGSARWIVGAVLIFAAPHSYTVTTFYYDLQSFLDDPRVTNTGMINFDNLSPGTDLTGHRIGDVTFLAPGASPLEVITGSTGVRGAMTPRTLPNILSPGGSNTSSSFENDDLELIFTAPIPFFGIDVVFEETDGSFTSVTFKDSGDVTLDSDGFIPDPNIGFEYRFVGLVSDSAEIARVILDEFDGSPPDDHIAYDNLVLPATVIPESSSTGLMFLVVLIPRIVQRLKRSLLHTA